jgi:predicted transposase YbfD/YdcC
MSLLSYFTTIIDPRHGNAKRHELVSILLITLCAIISGAETWIEIEEYGHSKQDWLARWLPLPSGIPSHDTFARVFALLEPNSLSDCLLRLVQDMNPGLQGQIALDGKRIRGASQSEEEAIHIVSAWACEAGLVLGEVRVSEKSNEITAVPVLLRRLCLEGCVVTLDALNTQKSIASQIREQGGDYTLSLKGNHPNLLSDVEGYFSHGEAQRFEGRNYSRYVEEDYGHGRSERRCYEAIVLEVEDACWGDIQAEWSGLRSLVRVCRVRKVGEAESREVHYYLSSLSSDAERIGRGIRRHWGIENSLHWVLDVAFGEDGSRIHKANAPTNLSIVRHLALNLLKQETSLKRGVRVKRSKAAWDEHYLTKVLQV